MARRKPRIGIARGVEAIAEGRAAAELMIPQIKRLLDEA
jgi:hypothetical protein